ncbi:MAG: hypothetical protein MZV70_12165 [Desulfobacterales bacterium]|nr:hypothetical protein [Desulfobacterales bacterium]
MTRAEQLAAEGWQRQSTSDEPRLSGNGGPVPGDRPGGPHRTVSPRRGKGCAGCLAAFPDRYRTIYTRKREDRHEHDILADGGAQETPAKARSAPLPTPGPGEVLLQVVGCGVCHTDLGLLLRRRAHQVAAALDPGP